MLELQGLAAGLLDEPLALRLRGRGDGGKPAVWRARLRDDDGRVWRARADRAEELTAAFGADAPAGAPPVAALRSLRPVAIEVRAELPDGRAAARTIRRALVGEGVRVRRWRGLLPGGEATLCRPAQPPVAAVIVDATSGEPDATVAALCAPLLASRGVLALTVGRGGGRRGAHRRTGAPGPRPDAAALLAAAAERLAAAVPGAPPADAIEVVAPLLAPGIPARRPADAAAWDALLARLGARPRQPAR